MKPMVTDFNIATGEITKREMTDAELAQYEVDKAASDAETI